MPVQKRLALAVFAMAVVVTCVAAKLGSRSAGGADSYGYISQADRWISGDLLHHHAFSEDDRPPVERWALSPLGWRPAPGSWDVVPTYAAGYPLMLAAAKRVGGHAVVFAVVPLMAGLLVWSTFLLGARLGREREGALAALFVASSATVLFMSMAPMSDVPSAALWTLTLALVLSPARRSMFDAGAVCALAILVRPNLFPLAMLMSAWLLVNDVREWRARLRQDSGADTRGFWFRACRALPFTALAAGGAIVTAAINQTWYGRASESGYGDLGGLFGFANIAPNSANYFRWLAEAETPLAVAGLAIVLLIPQFVNRRRDVVGLPFLIWIFVAAVWANYFLYRPFGDWWYLRFLLPTWPLIAIGSASLIAWLWVRRGLLRVAGAAICAAAVTANLWFAWRHDTFRIGLTESRYPQVARGVAKLTNAESGILTLQHSGTVRYYAGRMTLRWDLVEPRQFGALLAWMRSHGHHPYLLIDAGEMPSLRSRFPNEPALAMIEWPPLASFFRNETFLFDLDATGPAAPTRLGTYTRRVVEPVAPEGWLLALSKTPAAR